MNAASCLTTSLQPRSSEKLAFSLAWINRPFRLDEDMHATTSWVLHLVSPSILPVRDSDKTLLHILIRFFTAVSNGTVTLRYVSSLYAQNAMTHGTNRERDTTDQLIGKIDEVIAIVADLVDGAHDWDAACHKLQKYSGVQAVETS
jgi:hypothetical protein